MPNAAIRTDSTADPAVRTYRLGTLTVTVTPHYLRGIGPRSLVKIEETGVCYTLNLTPSNARLFAMGLTLGAGEAEKRERKEKEIEAARLKDGGVLVNLEQLLTVSQKA